MQPTNIKIEQPWLDGGSVQRVMQALAAGGGTARFVGGCVRDALFQRPVRDVDIATDTDPEEVMILLAEAGLKYVPTGLEHGTITAIADGQGYEVTTLRHDVETDGRRATVAFTDDWLIDAQRRDFTMNALYCDSDGTIYDPVGGVADIASGCVRFIGAAHDRITEDYLRILRFFRFHAWYGQGDMDPEGLSACERQKAGLSGLSVERIRTEFMRLLEAPDPLPTLLAMQDAGVMAAIVPQAGSLADLKRLVASEDAAETSDSLRRLASLFTDDMAQAIALGKAWKISNKDQKRLKGLAGKTFVHSLSEQQAKQVIYKAGQGAFIDNLLFWSPSFNDQTAEHLALAQNWDVPVLPLKGADIMARGVAEGQTIGKLLADLEGQWVDEGFTLSREDLLVRLDALISEE